MESLSKYRKSRETLMTELKKAQTQSTQVQGNQPFYDTPGGMNLTKDQILGVLNYIEESKEISLDISKASAVNSDELLKQISEAFGRWTNCEILTFDVSDSELDDKAIEELLKNLSYLKKLRELVFDARNTQIGHKSIEMLKRKLNKDMSKFRSLSYILEDVGKSTIRCWI